MEGRGGGKSNVQGTAPVELDHGQNKNFSLRMGQSMGRFTREEGSLQRFSYHTMHEGDVQSLGGGGRELSSQCAAGEEKCLY